MANRRQDPVEHNPQRWAEPEHSRAGLIDCSPIALQAGSIGDCPTHELRWNRTKAGLDKLYPNSVQPTEARQRFGTSDQGCNRKHQPAFWANSVRSASARANAGL